MEHKVTASKRRPKNFDLLIGQEFVKTSLQNSLTDKRIANAYLFSGPRGVGKTSTARLLAKALENPNGIGIENIDFDGAEEIGMGQSIDVYEIDGASNTSVDDVRKIKENILYKAQKFRYKIYIIDEVHMLSMSAFNALLKTIEEPPSYVVFIFATTETHKVPVTIKSRCQHFHFRLIPISLIKDELVKAAVDEDIKYEDEALLYIAKESGGSMRDAYTLFDQILSFSQGDITMEKIIKRLNITSMEDVNNYIYDILFLTDTKLIFEKLDELLSTGTSEEQLCIDFINYFRSLLLLKNNIKNPNIIGYDLKYFSKDVLDELDEVQIQKILDLLFDYYKNLKNSVNLRFEFELLISKIMHIKSYISNFELYSIAKLIQKNLQDNTIVNYNILPNDGFLEKKDYSIQKTDQEPKTDSQESFEDSQKTEEKSANNDDKSNLSEKERFLNEFETYLIKNNNFEKSKISKLLSDNIKIEKNENAVKIATSSDTLFENINDIKNEILDFCKINNLNVNIINAKKEDKFFDFIQDSIKKYFGIKDVYIE